MKAKRLDVKAGSICIYKNYGFFKQLWSKITKKELPFNEYKIYYDNSSIFVELTNVKVPDEERYIFLEPIKQYSKKEKEELKLVATEFVSNNSKMDDMFTIINSVRPSTIDSSNFSISGLLQNKYYKVLYDSKGKDF